MDLPRTALELMPMPLELGRVNSSQSVSLPKDLLV